MLAKRLVYLIIAYEFYLFMMSVTVFGPKVTRQTPATDLYLLRCRCEGFHQLLGYKDTKIVSGFNFETDPISCYAELQSVLRAPQS